MDEDQEYERFDVDNDYEGGEWVEDEFYYRNKRRKRSQTRDDQIYGVFGEDGNSSDSDGGGGRGGKPERRKEYSKPVGFVGGGVVGNAATNDNDEAIEDFDVDVDGYGYGGGGRGGLGLGAGGFGSSGGGLGLTSGGQQKHAEGDNQEEEELFPTAFGKRIKAAAEQRRKKDQEEAKKKSTSLRGGIGSNSNAPTAKGDVGAFEAHTKGIGSKLLSKMGWNPGQGLGKEGRGIAKPLEAKLRPKGMGMGYGDRREPKLMEEKTKPAAEKQKKKEEAVDIRAEAGMWKKKNAQTRVKRTFKSADELLEEENEGRAAAALSKPKVAIVDMRGPQTRILTNLEHLNVADEEYGDGMEGEEAMPMPELRNNMKMLVELSEADIQVLDGKLRQEKDTRTILEREKERLAVEAKEAAEAAHRVQTVLEGVEKTIEMGNDLVKIKSSFAELHRNYQEEYHLYNLSAIALGCALPVLTPRLTGWSPLTSSTEQSKVAAKLFAEWKPLLESDFRRHAVHLPSVDVLSLAASSDPYIRLLCEVLLPPLRRDIIGCWDPRDAATLEKFLEIWEPLLPVTALEYVMQHLVLPRLKTSVNSWDPTSDPVALHTWVHPWLPFLGPQLSELWPTVRFKFGNALEQWHPADQSAKVLLAPWKPVFSNKEWESLLNRAIIPKLEEALSEFQVNPAGQDLEPFFWVIDWADIMPASQMAKLLIARFFPKWHAALRHWLSAGGDQLNLDDVTRWYLQWKALFPENVLEAKPVKSSMNAALDAINTAGQGKPLPTTWTAAPAATTTAAAATSPTHREDHPSFEEAYGNHHHIPSEQAPLLEEERPLRALVEDFAAENEVDFLPKAGRYYQGLQVYGFGTVSCAVDSARQRLWAQMGGADGKEWVATSMSQLLEEHSRRLKSKMNSRK